ncbi:MAG: TolC family protein, partial [candidate division KSB1 bacterium]|nr:TolC family protein [candidate division KSB1 bacterium]
MDKTKWVTGILILLFMVAMPIQLIHGQPGKKLSLDECIEIALKNNSQLKNAERDIALSGADITTARSALLPNIDASFSSGRYIQGPRLRKYDVPVGIDTLTGNIIYEQKDISQSKTERNSHRASVELTQTVWDWGKSWNRLTQARLMQDNAEYKLIGQRNSVIYNVQEKYFEL